MEHGIRARLSAAAAKKSDDGSISSSRSTAIKNATGAFFMRFAVTLVVAIWAYGVMLAVMSYNIGVFFVVAGGIAVGRATFAGFIPLDSSSNPVQLPESSCGC
jgi:hypothetical protein